MQDADLQAGMGEAVTIKPSGYISPKHEPGPDGREVCTEHGWLASSCHRCAERWERAWKNISVALHGIAHMHMAAAVFEASLRKHREAAAQLMRDRDGAYSERNRCIAVLCRLALDQGFAAWRAQHEDGEPQWRNLVFVELPTGRASWHVHDSEIALFSFLPKGDNTWDGHSTPEKYQRLRRFAERKKPDEQSSIRRMLSAIIPSSRESDNG